MVTQVTAQNVQELITHLEDASTTGDLEITLTGNTYEFTESFGDTIYLDYQTIAYVGGMALPSITSRVTIRGNGSVLRNVASSRYYRCFYVQNLGTLTLENLTIDGFGYDDNGLPDGVGFAISNSGELYVNNCTLKNNFGHYHSATVYTNGPTHITNSKFLDNECFVYSALDINSGHLDTVTVENCIFANNVSEHRGAVGIGSTGKILFTGCHFINNLGKVSGAITASNNARISIQSCTFERNEASQGGAILIYPYVDNISINYCRFVNNTSSEGYNVEVTEFGDNRVDARYNYWGSSDGPSGYWWASGSGDSVSNWADYAPFLAYADLAPSSEGPSSTGDMCVVNGSADATASGTPISLVKGEKRYQTTDIALQSPSNALNFTRSYRQSKQTDANYQFMGLGWTHNHNFKLAITGSSPTREVTVYLGSGGTLQLVEYVTNKFRALVGSSSTLEEKPSGEFIFTAQDKTQLRFDSQGRLLQRAAVNGETLTYSYDGTTGQLVGIADDYGRALQLVYYPDTHPDTYKRGLLHRVGDHLADLQTPSGRYVEFDYVTNKIMQSSSVVDGTSGLLSSVRDIQGNIWSYAHYGQQAGETIEEFLNYITERRTPIIVDTNGDGNADSPIVLEKMTYAYQAPDAQVPDAFTIVQERGVVDGVVSEATELIFDGVNKRTLETQANVQHVHTYERDVVFKQEIQHGDGSTQLMGGDTTHSVDFRPEVVADNYNAQTNMGWSVDGKNLESVTDALGNATNFTYDTENRLTESVDAENRSTRYTYVGDTRQPATIEVWDRPEGESGTHVLLRKQTFDYDDKGRVLEEVVLDPENNAPLQKTTHTYHTSGDGNGLLASQTQVDNTNAGNNQTTSYTYDALGRLVKTQKSSLTGTCQFSYTVYNDADQVLGTACGLVNASPIPSNVTELLALYDVADTQKKHTNITLYSYDALGRRVSTTTRAGSTQAREQRTIYDALNRPVRVIQHYVDASYAAPAGWVFENGVWKDAPSGQTIGLGADLDQNLISDTVYNARGLVRLRRDALGNVTLYGYDVADRLIKTVQFASQPDYNNDTDGDVALVSYVASGAINADQISTQAYDANGNIVRREDVLGRVSLTGYDVLNRPVRQIQNASQPDYDWTQDRALADYDASTPLSLSPDEDLISETVYDNMGRTLEQRRLLENRGSAGEIWDTMRMVYDEWGRSKYQIAHYVPQGTTEPKDWEWKNQRWEDGAGNAIDHGTDNDQNIISQTMYDAEGRAYMTRDVLGKLQRTTYDGLGRPVLSIQNYVEQGSSLPEAWKWENQRWEDGDGNAIDHGANNDQNIIQQTSYDPDQRPHLTRNVQGDQSLTIYDAAGRTDKQIQRYVSQGIVTAWAWSETNQRWEDGASNPIDRGDNNNHDQNVIQATAYDDEQRIQSTRDVRGNVTRMVYDEAGRVKMRIQNYVLQGVSEPEDWVWNGTLSQWEDGASNPIDHGTDLDVNRIQSTEFDRAGRVLSTRDTVGRVQYHVYDVMGRRTLSVQNYVVQGVSTPDVWLWDATQSRWEDGAGNAIDHGTDNDQNLITQTSYNIAGQVVATRDTRGTRTDYIYDDAGRRVSVVQAVGTKLASQSYTCYDKAGRVRRTIANYVANGNDPDAWQTDAVETWLFVQSTHRYREDNLIATTSYDAASRRQSSTSPMGNIQSLAYDVAGRVVEVTDARGIITHYSYDGLGRRTQVVQNRTASNPESWLWNDTLSQWEDGATNAIAHGTDNDENIIVQVTYDVMGRVLTMRNPLGNVTTYAYDGLGRRTSLSNPLGLAWTTAYADVGNTTQTTQTYPGANDSTEYDVTRTFDRMGRLTGIQYGDTASTPDVALEYDLAGNRSRMSETDSTTTIQRDYAYDAMNRLKAAGESGAQVNYTYDAGGLRTQMTLPDGLSLDYAYDAKGQLISMTDWDGGKSTFRYDNLGRHTRTYRPNAMQSRYRYDADGRLRDLRHLQGHETLAQFQYEVDANGNRTEAREYLMPASAGNATQTYAYNHPDISFPHGSWVDEGHFKVADGWASWLKVRLVANSISFTYGTGPDHSLFDVYVGGSLWQSVDGYATERGEATLTIPLRYDGPLDFEIRNREEKNLQSTGYVVRFKQVQATSKLTSNNIAYTYDSLARLLLADYGTTQYQYGFDVAGNLVNNNGVTNTFNSANQLISSGTDTFEYDNNGNLWKTNGAISHTWDSANRLLSHGGLSYAYDGMGNRIVQNNGTDVTSYLLDVQPSLAKVMAQTTGANTDRFIHAPRGIHAMESNAGTWSYMLQDGLGSVRAETDNLGAVQASQNYEPYGEVFGANGTMGSPFAFTGEPLDGNGLQYHRARYYDPSMGMFNALDPFEGMHSRPMSLNGYSWVEGNTPNLTDASGRCVDNMVSSALAGTYLGIGDLSRFLLGRPSVSPSTTLVNNPIQLNQLQPNHSNGFCEVWVDMPGTIIGSTDVSGSTLLGIGADFAELALDQANRGVNFPYSIITKLPQQYLQGINLGIAGANIVCYAHQGDTPRAVWSAVLAGMSIFGGVPGTALAIALTLADAVLMQNDVWQGIVDRLNRNTAPTIIRYGPSSCSRGHVAGDSVYTAGDALIDYFYPTFATFPRYNYIPGVMDNPVDDLIDKMRRDNRLIHSVSNLDATADFDAQMEILELDLSNLAVDIDMALSNGLWEYPEFADAMIGFVFSESLSENAYTALTQRYANLSSRNVFADFRYLPLKHC